MDGLWTSRHGHAYFDLVRIMTESSLLGLQWPATWNPSGSSSQGSKGAIPNAATDAGASSIRLREIVEPCYGLHVWKLGRSIALDMRARRPMRFSERWRRADHNFAVATIVLMIFFVAVGFATWMLDEKSTLAPISAATANASKSQTAR
jgi:hypothetical protein